VKHNNGISSQLVTFLSWLVSFGNFNRRVRKINIILLLYSVLYSQLVPVLICFMHSFAKLLH